MTQLKNTAQGYDDSQIDVLEGLEGIRQRYDMYMGAEPTHHMVNEVLDNSIDEVMNGFADLITVTLNTKTNDLTISDNGRGMPNGMHPRLKRPTMEILFTEKHSGGKFDDGKSFKISSGKNGIGIKGLCALSEYVKVISERDDNTRRWMEFSKGLPASQLMEEQPTGKRGTSITFRPDKELLEKTTEWKFTPEKIKETCLLRAYLNKGLKISLIIDNDKYNFEFPNGIEDYITSEVPNPLFNMKPVTYETFIKDKDGNNGNWYEISLSFQNSVEENIKSFANGILNSKGTHETGFKTAVTKVISKFIKEKALLPKKYDKLDIKGDDIRKGIVCVINARVKAPRFKGQTKDELANEEVRTEVDRVTTEFLTEWLAHNEDLAKKLCNRVIQFAKAADDIKKAQDKIVKVSSSSSGLSFSPNFTDCTGETPEDNEVFLIEGKSAGGNVRNIRDPETQAVFPFRGKPLNAYGIPSMNVLSNNEFNELIKVLFGTTDIKNIDYDKTRYHKIIILADADDDGLHICSLLLTFFKEHFVELIKRGYIYIAQTPLYRITVNGKYKYFKGNKDYNDYKSVHISEKYAVHNQHISLKELVDLSEEFMLKFNRIKHKYALDGEIISSLLRDGIDGTLTYLANEGLEIDGLYAQGMFGDNWIDITFEGDIIDAVSELSELINHQSLLIIEETKTGDCFECDVYDAIEILNSAFKFQRYRFKGVGEISPEELGVTTLEPKTRTLLQVTMENIAESDEICKILFGNNADLRKDFIQEYILNVA